MAKAAKKKKEEKKQKEKEERKKKEEDEKKKEADEGRMVRARHESTSQSLQNKIPPSGTN